MPYRLEKGDIVVLPVPYGEHDYIVGVVSADYCVRRPDRLGRLKLTVGGEKREYTVAPSGINCVHKVLRSKDRAIADLQAKLQLLCDILGRAGTRVVTAQEAKKLGIESRL